jgi:cation transport regulator ChaC
MTRVGSSKRNRWQPKPEQDTETAEATGFHRQFEAVSEHNRTALQKALYLVILQGQAVGVLHSIPTVAMFEDMVETFQNRYGDHQLTQEVAERSFGPAI